MCTSGAVSVKGPDGVPITYALKTLDSFRTNFWHGMVQSPTGKRYLACGMTPQLGVNSGINDDGFCVVLSYLDYRGPFKAPPRQQSEPLEWPEDRRGIINSELLSRCQTVEEGIDELYRLVPHYSSPSLPGGNHILADAGGRIGIFEHCCGEMSHQILSDGGFIARGNNGELVKVEEQCAIPELARADREQRALAMANCLQKLDIVARRASNEEPCLILMKEHLASHADGDGTQIGAVCAHGVVAPGGRSSSGWPYWTLTGVIFDSKNRRMIYSVGNPCHNEWKASSFLD